MTMRITNKIKIKDLLECLDNNEFKQDIIQRPSGVWSKTQKKCLIQTIFRKDPYISNFIFCVDRNNNITCLDGQQRIETIKSFRDDEFSLNEATIEYLKEEGFDIKKSNQTYSLLKGILQERFDNMIIPIEWVRQEQDESDEVFKKRKNLWFQSINSGTSVKAHDKAVASALSKDKYPVQDILRHLNFCEYQGFEEPQSMTKLPDLFFTRPNKGNDKFSWASLYYIIWMIKQIHTGLMQPTKKKTLLYNKGSYIIPKPAKWISTSSEYIEDFNEELFNKLKTDVEMAERILQRKGKPIPNKSSSTNEMRKTSYENLCLIISQILNIDVNKFPPYPSLEEIEIQRDIQKRSGIADVNLITCRLTEFLNQVIPFQP